MNKVIPIVEEDVEMPDLHQRRYQLEPIPNYKWQVMDTNTGMAIMEGTFEDMVFARHHLNKGYYLNNPILRKVGVKYVLHPMHSYHPFGKFRMSASNIVFADMVIRSTGSLDIYDIQGEDPKIIDLRGKSATQNAPFPKVDNTSEKLRLAMTPFSDFVTRLFYDASHFADITINEEGHLTIHQLVGTSPTINDLRKNK
jgi:hypothetical protein